MYKLFVSQNDRRLLNGIFQYIVTNVWRNVLLLPQHGPLCLSYALLPTFRIYGVTTQKVTPVKQSLSATSCFTRTFVVLTELCYSGGNVRG